MAGLVPAIHVFFLGRETWMPGTSPGMTPTASLLRRRDRDQHRDHVVAAIDDLTALVRGDEAGIVRPEHGLLAASDERELARQHIVDLFRRRGVGTGAAAGQEMREADGELLRPAGVEAEQAQRGVAAMVG